MVRLGIGYRRTEQKVVVKEEGKRSWRTLRRFDVFEGSQFYPLGFGDDPNTILVASDHLSGRMGIYIFDLIADDFSGTFFDHPDIDVSGLMWSRDRKKIVGVRYTVDKPTVHYFDRDAERLHNSLKKALSGADHHVHSSSRDEQKMIISAGSDVDPGVFYFFDRQNGELRQIAEARTGLLPEHMAPMQPISYTARDGLVIHGYLTLPKGRGKNNLPLVVMPHGGPTARDYQDFDYWVQFLANRGYAVLQMNFRGSSGYGSRFQAMGYGEWGLSMQDDITDGTRWLIDEGVADPAHICIVGGSYGGYAALMGAVKTPDLFKCVVSFAGLSDLNQFLHDQSKFMFADLNRPRIKKDGQNLKLTSPHSNIDKIKVPILLIHGKDDRNVPVSQSKKMASALKKKKKPHRLVIIKKGDHYLSTQPQRLQFLRELEKFLAAHIG